NVGVRLAHGPADQRGIDAAAQEYADGHIRDEAQAHGFDEQTFGLVDGFFEGDARGFVDRGKGPVVALAKLARAPFQNAGWRHFVNALVDGARIDDVAELEVFGNGLGIDFAAETRGAERADGGSERDAIGRDGVSKRLHPEAVAHERERLLRLIPNGEGV